MKMKQIGQFPEIIANKYDRCGESPLWDWRKPALFWNDINGRIVHQMDPHSGHIISLATISQPAGMALAVGGGLLVAGADGIYTINDGKTLPMMKGIDGRTTPFNDIVATPTGQIYAGTLFWGDVAMDRTGCLYLINVANKSAVVVDEGIELSNGIGLSPDGHTLYYSDSTARRIYAYDINPDQTLSRKRVFAAVPDSEGIPDGLTIDAEGFVWSAQWYGGQVVRYDPDGKIERRIALPVKQVSSLAFGGDEMDCLFITTAGEHWDSAFVPRGYSPTTGMIGGALFAIRPGVQGRREHEVKIKITNES
ncbi:MAG TPA: SMP-30/gluconolactonase/LRE family protein [Tepidisphaeraceae bacterium]|jgi:D-xylonolactonase|nr:SMP-30/gluconolactonase/LRE family protein [Tepidisphaeraceae bacterium]